MGLAFEQAVESGGAVDAGAFDGDFAVGGVEDALFEVFADRSGAVLNDEPRIVKFIVESENFESIHNHSAYALIEKDKRVN